MARVIDQLVERMNAHDLDGVVGLMHPDYHSEQPAHPAREFGTSAQVRANWDAMFRGIPDFRAELLRSTDDGQTCWTEWHWRGNRTDGSPFDMRGVAIFELRDDRIAAARLYMEPVEHDGTDIEQAVENQSGLRPITTRTEMSG
jgi:ketosteroid isomerase-like protein